MPDIEAMAARILSDLSALPEEKMRLDLLGRRLSALEPGDAAKLIDTVYKKGADDKEARRFRALLVNPEGLRKALGEDRHRSIYHASVQLGLRKVSRLFTDLPPRKTGVAGYEKEEEAKMEFITLGQRRAMSKSNVKDTIDRLLSDPDVMVVNNLLNNPRLTEKEVLKIASKRPNSAQILKLVSTHRVWSKRYEVKKALILNPYTPPRISIALLELMLTQDLKLVAEDKTLHSQVKLSAKDLLNEREGK
ncbi:MAG: hypothetical protein HY893_01120 [Deltaproteobacteria bacterium]|nr:hypothetical protein [Deltaproteobacteria bacterium]